MKGQAMSIQAELRKNTRITPVSRPNKAEKVTKQADGSMIVEQASGKMFLIPASEIEMQAFVLLTMIDGEMTESP